MFRPLAVTQVLAAGDILAAILAAGDRSSKTARSSRTTHQTRASRTEYITLACQRQQRSSVKREAQTYCVLFKRMPLSSWFLWRARQTGSALWLCGSGQRLATRPTCKVSAMCSICARSLGPHVPTVPFPAYVRRQLIKQQRQRSDDGLAEHHCLRRDAACERQQQQSKTGAACRMPARRLAGS